MTSYDDLIAKGADNITPLNWTDFGSYTTVSTDTISPDGSGVYNIGFTFLDTITKLQTIDFGTHTDYYGTSSAEQTHFSTTNLTAQEAAVNTILGAPGSASPFSTFFADVAKVTFTSGNNGAIAIGANDATSPLFSDPNETGGGTYRWTATQTNAGKYGDVWLNDGASGVDWSNVSPGTDGFQIILHELGHALGLQHPDEVNTTSAINDQKFTVMSTVHTALDVTGVYLSGLQLEDISAMQSIYGRNYATRGTDDPGTTGVNEADTTYTWGTFSGVVQAFGSGTSAPFVYTIWDGAGTDVINAGGYSDPVEIDLRQGHFSAIGKSGSGSAAVAFDHVDGSGNETDHGNVAIGYYAVIENGIGSDGADNLIGNAWNNALYGGAGADDIYGDGLSYDADAGFHTDDTNRPGPSASANLSGDDILLGGTGNDILVGGKGNDLLHGGYNTGDVDSKVSGWNAAGELPSSSSNISYASDGIDTADYSRLYLSSTSWWTGAQSISAGTHGIDVIFSASEVGIVEKGTIDSSGVGSDGTDYLFSIEKVIGTAGDDRFFGGNGRTSSYSGADAPLHYYGGAGNDLPPAIRTQTVR